MEKTIQIGNKEVRLNNNIGWTIDYRDQFGTDIIPTLLPMVAAALDLIKGLLDGMEDTSNLEWQDVLKTVDGDLKLTKVIRFEVGEGIEKKEENFAEEVAAQMKK